MRWLILALMIISSSSVDAATRSPFFVVVKEEAITLLPNPDHYSDLFADEEKREIAVGDIAESEDFKKVLEYVLNHTGTSGSLRRRRDTIITFLIRPEGVETYRAAKQVVDKFERANEKRLAISVLPNGAPILDSLSGKTPFEPKLEGGEYEIRPPTPRDVPRNNDGNLLLREGKVLVRNGKVIPLIDPDGKMKESLKDKIRMIIDKNHINVEEFGYITDEKQALKVIDEFNKERIGNNNFEVKCIKSGNSIAFELLPTEECGEEPDKAMKGFFAEVLRHMQTKYYLKYLVEADSFEAYAEIRKATDRNGFYAGWTPISPGWYTYTFFSGYRIGVKPPVRPPRDPGKPGPVREVLD